MFAINIFASNTFLMKKIFAFLLTCLPFVVMAQHGSEPTDTTWKSTYRATTNRINDLVHTKLDIRFDYNKSYAYGKEWLTLQPHFYATDSVLLDAKGMELKEVALINGTTKTPLKYNYDGMQVNIKLPKTFTASEKYTLYFDYISKPNELKVEGSAAITDAKGLYFINPKGDEPNMPTQIWTQGETESNSAWMVTIDKPNQKTTSEIWMTVPDKYVTLSNGLKTAEKKNSDGTRTDTWKMDMPHAPYLFFMGVGEYAIIKDTPYKGKEVSYYVEKDQAQYAKAVFGYTPEMIKFYSEKLGVDYPWQKYAQIVGRNYVSGAMENTTATLHGEGAYQTSRELIDQNTWESVIAHELFHQWFGDLVTTESWSNITLNESFANYSEYLWFEYKYGKDYADAHHFQDMQGYLMSGSEKKDLVRYYYNFREDVFDGVSYNKGGRILHMLRNYVGDDAFFKSLNLYLTNNKFKSAEASQLRLAFEEVTGRDLNWFWNQWYYGSGHPKLKISYITDIPTTAGVVIEQTQKTGKVFTLPIAIDVYENGKPTRYNIWVKNKVDTFYFQTAGKPDFVNVDADKILLAEKTDSKTENDFINQWKYAKNYLDRREALDFFAKKGMPEIAKGLNDKFAGLREFTIAKIAGTPYKTDKVVLEEMERLAGNDKNKKVRAAAISFLGKQANAKYKSLFETALTDSSYSVAGAGLEALSKIDKENAYALAKKYGTNAAGKLGDVASGILIENATEADFDIIHNTIKNGPLSENKLMKLNKYASYLAKLSDLSKVKTGIDDMLFIRNQIPKQYLQYVDSMFESAFKTISDAKGAEIEKYVADGFKK